MIPEIELRNGVKIPQVGLGTWQITDRDVMKEIVRAAVNIGYQMFDTAAAYCNEIAIAKAIEVAGIAREEVFVSNKVWNTCRGYKETQDACKRSLKKLKMDYIDLYLIHWPASKKLFSDWKEINAETWRGMEKLYSDGLVRAIGVCNFKVHHLEELRRTANIKPFINQIEYHPGFYQQEIVNYCVKNEIVLEASSPLGNGKILENETLIEISNRYKKSVAQICLRWAIQNGFIVIPKTQNIERLRSNIDIFDFEISRDDMEIINKISYCGGIGLDADEVIEFG